MAKSLFMESTAFEPVKTASEIHAALVNAGATHVISKYDSGKIVAMHWVFNVGQKDLMYEMPARVEPVYKILLDRARKSGYVNDARLQQLRMKAERVAWRQLFRWVQAQLAMVASDMMEAPEVFLPYWQAPGSDKTLYAVFKEQQFKALPAPAKDGA